MKLKTEEKTITWAGLIGFYLFLLAGAVGWVMNIFSLVQSDFTLTGMVIARAIGIFVVPLGAVLGYF